jgi:hypothetical protein
MIEALISGKVYGRPEQRVGSNSGKPFVTAKVRAATSGGEMLFVNVLALRPSPRRRCWRCRTAMRCRWRGP